MPSASLALPPGYELLQALSRHGNRHVLRCRRTDGSHGTTILKCLLAPYAPPELSGFRDEFLLLDALVHPSWVRPRRFGALPADGWYLELEECPGLSLAQWPLRGWWPENLDVARQLLSGLEALHRLGYAQLDLNPAQVLVDPAPTESRGWSVSPEEAGPPPAVRMLDLGLAARFGTPLAGRGTPGYMAPELLQGRTDWDGRTDLYALGAILFELFTGAPAFPGASVAEILSLQTSGAVPDPGASAGLPPPVRLLIRELLEPDPDRRPTSALEVWQRLREQVPQGRSGTLPVLLEPGTAFAFQGRDLEIRAFTAWLARVEGAGRAPEAGCLRCVARGDEGIGRRRLVRRLSAVAQTRGWVLEETTPWPALRRLESGARLLLQSGPGSIEDSLRGETAIVTDEDSETLVLRLGPLSAEEQERVLQGQGMEAPALRATVAAQCLGVPGRLETLLPRIPREVDLAARYVDESSAAESMEEISPPEDWVRHARRLLDALPSPARDPVMVLALLESGCAAEDLRSWVAESGDEEAANLEPVRRRGFVREESGRWRFVSVLWARAVAGSDPERRARVGAALLRAYRQRGAFLDPAAAFQLALRLGDPGTAGAILPGALRHLETAGRLEDAIGLWTKAALGGVSAEVLYGEEVATPLLRETFPLARVCSRLLPPAESLPRTPRPADAERLLSAWASMTRSTLGVVEELLRDPCGSPLLEFIRLWTLGRTRLLAGDQEGCEAAVARMRAVRGDLGFEPRIWTDALRAVALSDRQRWDDSRLLYNSLRDRLGLLPSPLQATVASSLGHVELQRGRAEEALCRLKEADDVATAHGMQLSRLNQQNTLSGVLYQRGDLAGAQRYLEHVIWKWARVERWTECVLALTNLSAVLLDRGRMGEGLRAALTARDLALRAGDARSIPRAASRHVYALTECGQLDRATELASRLLATEVSEETRYGRTVVESRARAAMTLGHREDARRDFRQVLQAHLTLGGTEDAKETLLRWTLLELDSDEPERAGPLLLEAKAIRTETSLLTRSLEYLAAGEVALLAGEPAAETTRLLRQAATLLDAQDRWSLAWRAHWKLAESLVREGRAAEAAGEYATARSILMSIAESLRKEAPVGPFLELPAVRRFLESLGES